jgi:hypothetical protein
MKKLTMLCLVPFLVVNHASAATLGVTCAGRTEIIVAPSLEEAEQCAAAFPKVCVSGFSAVGGHYAVAETPDGRGLGAAGGFRSANAVAKRALASCAKLDNGACAIILSGIDDGKSYLNCKN